MLNFAQEQKLKSKANSRIKYFRNKELIVSLQLKPVKTRPVVWKISITKPRH